MNKYKSFEKEYNSLKSGKMPSIKNSTLKESEEGDYIKFVTNDSILFGNIIEKSEENDSIYYKIHLDLNSLDKNKNEKIEKMIEHKNKIKLKLVEDGNLISVETLSGDIIGTVSYITT